MIFIFILKVSWLASTGCLAPEEVPSTISNLYRLPHLNAEMHLNDFEHRQSVYAEVRVQGQAALMMKETRVGCLDR